MVALRYICEFFFTNFWHWIGLVIVLMTLCPFNHVRIGKPKKEEERR